MQLSDLKNQVKKVVNLFVEGKYETLVAQDQFRKDPKAEAFSSERLKEIVEEYARASGLNLSMPPDSAFDMIRILEYEPQKDRMQIRFDLWYGEELSDLSLTLEIYERDTWDYGLSSLHVW